MSLLALALAPIIAGLIILFVGASLLLDMSAPRRWMIGSYVLLEVSLLGTGLVLLPFALQFPSF